MGIYGAEPEQSYHVELAAYSLSRLACLCSTAFEEGTAKTEIFYLEDGRCSISNSLAENCIRPFVIGRKNWLFAGSPQGAEASAGIYTLVETAKVNGQEKRC